MGNENFEQLINFLSNSWVVGLVTGIIVYFVTKVWENFKYKKQYMQSVKLANKEFFNTLKLCVPEEKLPNTYTVMASYVATSNQYNVKIKDMDEPPLIIYALIKEVMDSNFLSYNDKLVYVDNLRELEKSVLDFLDMVNEEEEREKAKEKNDKLGWYSGLSAVSSLIAALFSFFLSNEQQWVSELTNTSLVESLVILLTTAGVSCILVLIVMSYRINKAR